jgi:predicted transcriptional regulator
MTETGTVTVRLDAQLKKKLEALAISTHRSKSWLAAEAIAAYVEENAWQIEQIEEAVKEADKPEQEWISHEQVSSWLDSWGTEDEKDVPCP